MKVMKYFAVASLALFAACNNEENLVVPEGANQPVDVMMSVALPGPGTRAAMGDLQNTANNGDPATVEKLHVYLLKGDDIVFAKEFTKGSDDFTKLTSSTAVVKRQEVINSLTWTKAQQKLLLLQTLKVHWLRTSPCLMLANNC